VVLMVICGVLVVGGLAAIVRWGGLEVAAPVVEGERGERPSTGLVVRRYVWGVTVAVVAGLGAGVLLAGAGGRLAMRLLAATAGGAAQGRLTEADETVGVISTAGTIGFVVFVGLFFGLATGALYLLLRRWLPRGRLGGLAFGALLLVVLAVRADPLRADNPDFDIVGPGWLAALVFSALVLAHGMLVAALAGRYSRTLPLLSRRRASIGRHGPLLLLGPVAPVLVPVALAGAVAVVATRVPAVMRALRSSTGRVVGRVVLVAMALVALPGFVADVGDILGKP
jgi:hypothetical protein